MPPSNVSMPMPNLTPNYTEGDATYAATVAELQHQYETTLVNDQEALKDSWTNATYQRALMGKAEPQAVTQNANRMNASGLLESGATAQGRTSVLNAAQNRRNAITNSLAQKESATSRAEEEARTGTTDKLNTAVAQASERAAQRKMESEARAKQEAAANAPKPPPTPGTPGTPWSASGSGKPTGSARPGWEWFQQKDGSWSERPTTGAASLKAAKAKGKF